MNNGLFEGFDIYEISIHRTFDIQLSPFSVGLTIEGFSTSCLYQ